MVLILSLQELICSKSFFTFVVFNLYLGFWQYSLGKRGRWTKNLESTAVKVSFHYYHHTHFKFYKVRNDSTKKQISKYKIKVCTFAISLPSCSKDDVMNRTHRQYKEHWMCKTQLLIHKCILQYDRWKPVILELKTEIYRKIIILLFKLNST